MKPRDPKKIILPGQPGNTDAERLAIEQIQMENALRNNPLFGIVAELRQQMKQLIQQNRHLTIRVQSLMDYLSHVGLLLHQEIDEQGVPQGEPVTPFDYQLFEKLIEHDVLDKMPTYGYTSYYVEHEQRATFLIEMLGLIGQGLKTMEEVLDFVRNFNQAPGRILPIVGMEFGLDQYLSTNPDGWEEEKCDAIALEFGLQKQVTEEEEDIADGDGGEEDPDEHKEDEETNVLPFEASAEGSGPESR